ncbi:MAG: AmmeMemoRadiSam system protein B [Candidatus Falkowbacteria bacterium]
MIKAAFITPHSPILIPSIGKANTTLLAKTLEAYKKIEEKLSAMNIDKLIIISPHGRTHDEGLTLNVAPEFEINFETFGDFATKMTIAGDQNLAQTIKDTLKSDFNIRLISETDLDYGSGIPIYLLAEALKNVKIISIPSGAGNLADYFEFGKKLKEVLQGQDENIAVIASGDLSHKLKRRSPAGYSPKGAKFDNKVIEYLNSPKTAMANILKMDTKTISDVMECGLKPISLLLGILDESNFDPKMLAYQTDFGIGYLTMDMNIEA